MSDKNYFIFCFYLFMGFIGNKKNKQQSQAHPIVMICWVFSLYEDHNKRNKEESMDEKL